MVATWPRMVTVRTKKRTDAREENKRGRELPGSYQVEAGKGSKEESRLLV